MTELISNSRTRKVGIALEDAQLSRAIAEVLVRTGKYNVTLFNGPDVPRGSWSEIACSVLVTSPAALQQIANAKKGRMPHSPAVILALTRRALACHRDQIAFADSFVLTDETLARLPSLIALSDYGLSIMPHHTDMAIVNPQLRRLKELSRSEVQMLAELGRGNTNQDIATKLGISVGSVKARVRNVMRKLRFRNRMETALFAALWVLPFTYPNG